MTHDRTNIGDPVRELLDEHVLFLAALEELVEVTSRIEISTSRIAPELIDSIQLLWASVDKHLNVHFIKEEEIFFPAIERLFPAARIKFQFLHVDHDRLREAFEKFTDLLLFARHERLDANDTVSLRSIAQEMVRLFYYHIVAEDVVYLDVASAMLTTTESRVLSDRMHALEERLRERCGAVSLAPGENADAQ